MKRNTRARKSKNKPRARTAEQELLSTRSLVHRPFPFLPDKFMRRLVYVNEEAMTNGASATIASNFKVNSLFDLDNNFGSTAVSAATALGTIWTRTTVLGGTVHIRAQNRESISNGFGLIFTNTNPGTSGSGLYIKSGDRSSSFRRGHFELLAPVATGGSNRAFTMNYSVPQIVGSTRPYTDDNFSALIGVDPTDLVWLTLFADTGSATVQTNGIKYTITLEVDVLFSQRASLSS